MGFEYKGFDKLTSRLNALNAALTTTAEERMVRAGANIFKKKLQQRAPVIKPGTAGKTSLPPNALKQGMGITVRKQQKPVEAHVGPRGRELKLVAWDVEYGHRGIHHGVEGADVQAHPFVRPAYEEGLAEAEEAMIAEVGKMVKETENV